MQILRISLKPQIRKGKPINPDIFKAKAPPLFGLDISSSSVKMLEIVDAGSIW